MIVGKIENGLERRFVKRRLNCLLITDPKCYRPVICTSSVADILVKDMVNYVCPGCLKAEYYFKAGQEKSMLVLSRLRLLWQTDVDLRLLYPYCVLFGQPESDHK